MAGITARTLGQPQLKPAAPQGAVATGPSPMDVLRSGGTYNYSRNAPQYPGHDPNPPDTFTPGPIGGLQSAAPAGQQAQARPALPQLPSGFGGFTNPAAYTPPNPVPQVGLGGVPQISLPPQVSREAIQPPTAPGVPQIQAPDMTAANAAAFARAKDQVGQTARGALTGLAGAMAGRGTVGSGVEGRGMSSIINAGQGQLGDVSREQAISGANLAQRNAELGFTGGITQRGQDLAAIQARNDAMLRAREQDISQRGQDINTLSMQRGQDINQMGTGYQGAITQRGQDLSAQEAAAQRALQALLAQYQGNIRMAGY